MSHIVSKEIIKQFLPENPIVLEAGAHIGRDTVKMARLWPQAQIHAFEPAPSLFEQLNQNTAEFSNIHCYSYALSDHNGNALFYESHGINAISSLHKPNDYFKDKATFIPITVQTITIDSWAAQYQVPHIDFMWLDLQGHELIALQGALQILKTTRVILTEINLVQRYENAIVYHELRQWLADHNFELRQEALHKKDWGNALFIAKNL
ncbi:MAG: hypothetical protein OHK0036_18790 [Bacteroidia bacterium]